MSDPLAQHAAYLAALDRQIERWLTQVKFGWRDEGEYAGMQGRRSILVRHAPKRDRFEGYYVCASHPEIGRWEDCPDWRDAAGLLPEVGPTGSNLGVGDAAGRGA